jgi:hypothetical protein
MVISSSGISLGGLPLETLLSEDDAGSSGGGKLFLSTAVSLMDNSPDSCVLRGDILLRGDDVIGDVFAELEEMIGEASLGGEGDFFGLALFCDLLFDCDIARCALLFTAFVSLRKMRSNSSG